VLTIFLSKLLLTHLKCIWPITCVTSTIPTFLNLFHPNRTYCCIDQFETCLKTIKRDTRFNQWMFNIALSIFLTKYTSIDSGKLLASYSSVAITKLGHLEVRP